MHINCFWCVRVFFFHSFSFSLSCSNFKLQPSTSALLPKENPPKPFRSPLNTGEVFVKPQHNQQTVFAPTQHLPQFQEIKQFNPAQQQVVHTEYGPPPSSPYPYPYPLAPPSSSASTPFAPPSPPVHEVIDETPLLVNNDDTDDGNESNDPNVIAIANASGQYNSGKDGQYYILGKDSTLQRVVYRTSQTEEDNINNGFTAHLRYTLVPPITDPIYGYDEEGHLVRLYNRKK